MLYSFSLPWGYYPRQPALILFSDVGLEALEPETAAKEVGISANKQL